ncbi:MAG: AmmeMemoRadiSam system protein B [Pirellulales bacterium]
MAPELLRPRLRSLELFPLGPPEELLFALRDPEGFADGVALPYPAAMLATLMDGSRTLSQIQSDFQSQAGAAVALADLEQFVARLDAGHLLDSPQFSALKQSASQAFLDSPVRAAAHAGTAYASDAEALRRQLAECFDCDEGPGIAGPDPSVGGGIGRLRGVLSPHIDLNRGGPAFAWAYQCLVEDGDADVFVILGTSHSPLAQVCSVSRKHFATPLGTVETDGEFIDRLDHQLASTGIAIDVFQDELVHRHEHSIEFQVLFLQYLLSGRRPFKVVPILTGSFQPFVASATRPTASAEFTAFVAALRATEAAWPKKVCYISGGDLAHVGPRFGDDWLLDEERLAARADDDHRLLAAACDADAEGFFDHVARQRDAGRICGLSPTYTLMQVAAPSRGELLKYSQAVDESGTSCVSFASLAFYA